MKGGNVYLTAKDKEMIDDLIDMYYVSVTPDEETQERIHRLKVKIEK